MYEVYNHNDTLLGEFTTLMEAVLEVNFYTEQTGNAAYVRFNAACLKD
jgi:hypothetical protein